MRRGLVAFIVLTLVGLGITGCGLFRFEQREPWRTQAEEACLSQRLVQPTAYMAQSSKIDGPGVCGMDYPFKVSAFSSGSVGLTSKVTLACPIISRIDTWLDEVVKPAAMLYYGMSVVDLRAGSYSCRSRNNRVGAKLSEHSFGNAMDVMAFVLADGRQVSVEKGWRNPADQEFLREVFVGACRYFTTVLAPGSDAEHYNHIHIDLARHDPRGTRHYCRPILKFTPRIDPEQTRGQIAAGRAPAPGPAYGVASVPGGFSQAEGPIDIGEEGAGEDEQSDSAAAAPRPADDTVRSPASSYPRASSPLSPEPVYPAASSRPGSTAVPPPRASYPPASYPRASYPQAAYPQGAPSPAPYPPARQPTPLSGSAAVYNRPEPQPILNGHGLY
jgi:hypothetical protein